MDFFEKKDGFCESTFWNEYGLQFWIEEPLASVTALWIVYVGVYGLFKNSGKVLHFDDVLTFACLIANGLSSCLFHATLAWGFGLLDGITMVVASYLPFAKLMFTMCMHIKRQEDPNFVYNSNNFSLRHRMLLLCVMLFMFVAMSLAAVDDGVWYFRVIFALPLVLIWIPIIYFARSDLAGRGWLLSGGTVVSLCGIFWSITEVHCDPAADFFYFHGFVWHLMTPIGMYYMIVGAIWIDHLTLQEPYNHRLGVVPQKCSVCCSLLCFPVLVYAAESPRLRQRSVKELPTRSGYPRVT